MTYTLNIAQSTDQNVYPLSEQFIKFASGAYSDNMEEAYNSFYALVNYFESGCATTAERQFLVTENNNFIEHLIRDLRRDYPEASELLRSAVEQVIATTEQENPSNYDLEDYSDEEEIDIMGDHSATDA